MGEIEELVTGRRLSLGPDLDLVLGGQAAESGSGELAGDEAVGHRGGDCGGSEVFAGARVAGSTVFAGANEARREYRSCAISNRASSMSQISVLQL